jgi:hypothetical protein
MPDIFINIEFIGGGFDGEVLKNISVNQLPPRYYFRNDVYFAHEKSGGMSIRKGKLNKDWHSYSADIYARKHEKNKPTGNEVYEFVESVMVDRCSFLTNKKTICMEPVINGELQCSTHKKET